MLVNGLQEEERILVQEMMRHWGADIEQRELWRHWGADKEQRELWRHCPYSCKIRVS
jgi:hypothetical protein